MVGWGRACRMRRVSCLAHAARSRTRIMGGWLQRGCARARPSAPQAIKILFGGWLLRMRDRWMRKRRNEEADALRYRKIEWRSALYGLLFSIANVRVLQFIVLCSLLFWPPKILKTL